VVWGYALLPPVDIAQIADSGDEVLGTTTFDSTILVYEDTRVERHVDIFD